MFILDSREEDDTSSDAGVQDDGGEDLRAGDDYRNAVATMAQTKGK